FNPSNSVFFRYTSSDQTRVGTGGIVGETATGETFGKQYVLSYYHQFNPSTILDAQFGHVDLTNNVGNSYENLDPTTVVNGAGLAEVFGAEQTANPEAPTGTGDAMAAFLIGTAASASRRDTVAPVTGQRSYGFYFMDKWKVTDRLIVNVGLRYDLMLWPGYG